ncbi:lipopolysaccharide biosynthesis protein [Clostridium ihumii]|uniref:lipopolysaccharide biosynthesis protein n=1 Tax=Clostridium ihumii TaxID=1470356 RepID=UPI003D347885
MKEEGLLKKFTSFSFGTIIATVLGVITVPVTTTIFSPEATGTFGFFTSIGGLVLSLAIYGMDQAFVRFFYAEEECDRSILLYKCLRIPIINIAILTLISIIFRKMICNFIFGEYSYFLIIVWILNIVFLVLNRFSLMVIRMEQHSKRYSMLTILSKVFNFAIMILAFLYWKDNYICLLVAYISSNIIITIIAIISEQNYWVKKQKDREIKTCNKDIISYARPWIVISALTFMFQTVDRIVIKFVLGYKMVGIYSGATTIVNLIGTIQACFCTFWVPVAFERYEKNHDDFEFFEKVNFNISCVMFLLSILIISFKDIIILFLGSRFREGRFIIPFLSFMPIMYTISETTVVGINFNKKQEKHIYISLVSSIVNIIGNIVLVPMIGVVGAGISTGLSYILFFIMRTNISLKYYKVNYNLKKFYTMTFIISLYALYATFNTINVLYALLGFINLIILIILYKESFNYGISYIKKFMKNKSLK